MSGKTLDVFTYDKERGDGEKLGTITFDGTELKSSDPGIQDIVESRIRLHDGDAQQAFDSLSGWSNGYMWVKPAKKKKKKKKKEKPSASEE